MDIRKKLSQLKHNIQRPFGSFQGLSPEDDVDFPDDIPAVTHQFPMPSVKSGHHRDLGLGNPDREKEILATIDSVYFRTDSDVDPGDYELRKLPAVLVLGDVEDNRKRIKEQLSVVSKKISDLILENHPSYAAELKKVAALQKCLLLAYDVCCTARSNLRTARDQSTTVGIQLLARHRKLQLLRQLADALHTIKTLQDTDIRLRELIQEGNYSGAIQLCLECQKAADTYRHFECIGELSCKLQDTLVMMEEQLDVALAGMALHFDADRYRRLIQAYWLLGKTQAAADQLLMHVGSGIHNSAISVLAHSLIAPLHSSTQSIFFADLCKQVPKERFLETLYELCGVLWRILFCFHGVLRFHLEDENLCPDFDFNFSQKLLGGLSRVWQDAVHKVDILLRNADLSGFKFDNFLQVVELANRFMDVGRRYFACESQGLSETVQEQTASFFKCYHHSRMEELRLFLESEAWELCPVQKKFSIFDLQELSFLKQPKLAEYSVDESVPECRTVVFGESEVQLMDLSLQNPFLISPWDGASLNNEERNGDNAQDSDDSDVPEELKQDFVDDGGVVRRSSKNDSSQKRKEMSPIVSNTSLNLLRLFGRYMHMASLLRPIAFEVVTSLAQLFDYYFYIVTRVFGWDAALCGVSLHSPKLSAALGRMEKTLSVAQSASHQATSSRPSDSLGSDPLSVLPAQVVAVESLVYVSDQLFSLESHLQAMIPRERSVFLQQLYSQTVSVSGDVRRAVYGGIAVRALNSQLLLQSVSCVNWEISELMSQHSPYVDFLVEEFKKMKDRLDELSRWHGVPNEACKTIWEVAIQCTNRVLIEGYASAKKCSNEGRALMQLDFQQLIRKLEAVTGTKKLPDRDLVENYIKAYYIPETSIEQWILEHKEYSARQKISLLSVATHISKKTRQRLIANLDDPSPL